MRRTRTCLFFSVLATVLGMLAFTFQYSSGPLLHAASNLRPLQTFNASPARDVIPALPHGSVFDDVSGRVVKARPEVNMGDGLSGKNNNMNGMLAGHGIEGGLGDGIKAKLDNAPVAGLNKEDFASIAAVSNVGSVAGAASNIDSIPMAPSLNLPQPMDSLNLQQPMDSNAARQAAVVVQRTKQDVAPAAERSVGDNVAASSSNQFQSGNTRLFDSAGYLKNQQSTPEQQSRAVNGPKEPCPASYALTGPDEEWFRTQIQQRSPLRNLSRAGGVTEVEELPQILILTPISNTARNLHRYFANLCALTYPHHLISIVLGEDSSIDGTFDDARKHADLLRPHFARIEVIHLRGSTHALSGNARHMPFYQLARRRHLAAARNQLLFAGLSWGGVGGRAERVLWMDSDVKHIPADIVERLTAVERSIVVPNCLYRRDNGQTDTFDRNTWRDTDASRKKLEAAEPNFLMLEGYEPTKRKTLNDLKGEGDLVKIDGVGGCILLVDAQLHREGLVFPAFTFDHHIETEGLAKMAARLGIDMYGLPSVNVIHA